MGKVCAIIVATVILLFPSFALPQITVTGDVSPTFTGGSSWNISNEDLWIGDFDVGAVSVDSGTIESGGGHIGLFGDGSMTLQGAGSVWRVHRGGLEMGTWANSELLILNGGRAEIVGDVDAVLGPGASAMIEVDGAGSLLDIGGSLRFFDTGAASSGLAIRNGGTVRIDGALDVPDASMLQFDAGTLEIGGRLSGFNGPISADMTLNLTDDQATWALTAPTTIAGALGGVGRVTSGFTLQSGGALRLGTTLNPLGRILAEDHVAFSPGSHVHTTAGMLRTATRPWTAIDVLGTAEVNGGTVHVDTIAVVPVGTECRFLRTTGGLTVNTEFLFDAPVQYDIMGEHDAFDYWYVLAHNPDYYSGLALTPNQRSVAEYLEWLADRAEPGSDLAHVLDEFNHLPADEAREVLEQIGGQSHASRASQSVMAASVMMNTVLDQLRPSPTVMPGSAGGGYGAGTGRGQGGALIGEQGGATIGLGGDTDAGLGEGADSAATDDGGLGPLDQADGATCDDTCDIECGDACGLNDTQCLGPNADCRLFMRGFGQGGSIVDDGNARTMASSFGGFILGSEERLGQYDIRGYFYSYGKSYTNVEHLQASSETDTHWLGIVHSHVFPEGSYCMGSWTVGFDTHRSDRRLQFRSIDRTATAKSSGWQSILYGELGVLSGYGERLGVQPYFGLQHTYVRQNGADEDGALSLNLGGGGMDIHSLRHILGGRIQWVRGHRPRKYSPDALEFRGAWTHEYTDNLPPSFNGVLPSYGGPGFQTSGIGLGRDWATLGVGLRWQRNPQCSWFLDYDTQFNGRQGYHMASGGLEWRPDWLPTVFRFAGQVLVDPSK